MGLRLRVFVEEWAGDVTGAVAEKENGVGDDLFGVAFLFPLLMFSVCFVLIETWLDELTGCVGRLQTQDQDKCCVVWTSQVIADQPPEFMVFVQKP